MHERHTAKARRRRGQRLYLLIVLVLAGGLAWLQISRIHSAAGVVSGQQIAAPKEGFLAPEIQFTGLDGQPHALSEFKGHPIILNFWATWCPPCRGEMPALEAVYKAYAADGLLIIGVNQMEDSGKVSRFQEQFHLTFPIFLDKQGQAGATYRARGLPSSFFIDQKGFIRKIVVGGMNEPLIQGQVSALLGKE